MHYFENRRQTQSIAVAYVMVTLGIRELCLTLAWESYPICQVLLCPSTNLGFMIELCHHVGNQHAPVV